MCKIFFVLISLIFNSHAEEAVVEIPHNKFLQCTFSVEKENHEFTVFKQTLNSKSLMVLFKDSLSPSFTSTPADERKAIAAPIDFSFNIGFLGKNEWQSHADVHLDKLSPKGRVRTGKITLKTLKDGKIHEGSNLNCKQS